MIRFIGLGLTVVGAVLIFWAYQASESFGSQMSEFFRGSPTDRTIWLLIAGVITAAAGLGTFLRGRLI
jgi:hypothetical protein